MKKLIFIVTVAFSSIGNAQYDIKLINNIKAIFNINDDKIAIKFLDSLNAYAEPLKTIKYGDSDAPFVRGLLATLLTDSLTKYKYIQANPRIASLHIKCQNYNPQLQNKEISFITWIENYVHTVDTTKFEIVYTSFYYGEFLYVYDKQDINHTKWLRIIAITYGDVVTNRDDPYNNLANIRDTNSY